MDNWNADLVLHVIQYLSVLDGNRFRLSGLRYFYLVQQYRRIRGAEMVSNISHVRSLRSTTTTQSPAQVLTHRAAAHQLQTEPNLALSFSTLSSTVPEDLALYLPSQAVTLGVVSGSIQSTVPSLDCRSNAGIMLGHLPNVPMKPFVLQFHPRPPTQNTCESPTALIQQLLGQQQEQQQSQPWEVFMVYACGPETAVAEEFVSKLQAAFPQSTIVGGICTSGYFSESTQGVTRSDLESLSSVDLMQWYRGLGGGRGGGRSTTTTTIAESPATIRSWTKAQLLDRVCDLLQRRPYRLRLLQESEGAIFGVALAGDVPVKSVVSRGVRSTTQNHTTINSTTTRSSTPTSFSNFVIHQAAIHSPGDDEYMFTRPRNRTAVGVGDGPSYHIVRSIRDMETNKLYTPHQLRQKFSQPDFVGLQRPGEGEEDGFTLHMPHPLSLNLDAFIFIIEDHEQNDQESSLLEGALIDFFDMTGEACLEDMDRTMEELREETKDEELLGAIMISCSARGPDTSSFLCERMADATRFARVFPHVPCLGFYADGEIGPLALAGRRPVRHGQQQKNNHSIFQQGQAALQGFTAVFALFVVPKFAFPTTAAQWTHYSINDDPQHTRQFLQSYLQKTRVHHHYDDTTTVGVAAAASSAAASASSS